MGPPAQELLQFFPLVASWSCSLDFMLSFVCSRQCWTPRFFLPPAQELPQCFPLVASRGEARQGAAGPSFSPVACWGYGVGFCRGSPTVRSVQVQRNRPSACRREKK